MPSRTLILTISLSEKYLVETLIQWIERLQHEQEAMKAYHRRYLDRRARSGGISTGTDATMEAHQQTIAETLDLLETIKAMSLEETA